MSKKAELAKRLWLLTLLCISIPVFYVLSIGPAAFLYDKFDFVKQSSVGKTLSAAYSPLLDYLKDSDTLQAKLLHRYIELWVEPD